MKKKHGSQDLSAMRRRKIEEYAASLMEENGMQQAANEQLEHQMNWLMEQVRLHRQARFGTSSEKDMLTEEEQLSLFFNEAESTQDQELAEPELSDVKKHRKKAESKGESIKNLPVKLVEYTLAAEEQNCPACGETLHVMKKEVRNEIIVVPAQFTVKRHVHYVYAMPLYRQEQQYARLGMTLTRQTMSNWVVNAAEQYLSQIYDRMKGHLMKESLIHADETELEVLKEPGREGASKSYMWLYRSGAHATPCILYEYTPGRSGDYPKKFLTKFSSYLQTDGYAGYHKVTDDVQREAGTVIGAGCFAMPGANIPMPKKLPGHLLPPTSRGELRFVMRCLRLKKNARGTMQKNEKNTAGRKRSQSSLPTLSG